MNSFIFRGAPVYLNDLSIFSSVTKACVTAFRSILPKNGVFPGKEKNMFDRFVDPTFRTMRLYHLNYLKIIRDAEMIARKNSRKQFEDGKIENLSDANIGKLKPKIIKFIENKRGKDQFVRDVFRHEVKSYLHAVDHPEMRNFILSCADYFVLPPPTPGHMTGEVAQRGRQILDSMWVDSALKGGGDQLYNSPATETIHGLEYCETYQDIEYCLIYARDNLSHKFNVVMQIYYRIDSKRKMY